MKGRTNEIMKVGSILKTHFKFVTILIGKCNPIWPTRNPIGLARLTGHPIRTSSYSPFYIRVAKI